MDEVEEVAKAIFSIKYIQVFKPELDDPLLTTVSWDEVSDHYRDWCRAQAKAAIEIINRFRS